MARKYAIEWDERLGPAANARRQLAPLAAAYFARVRTALAKGADFGKLHRLRLEAKKLRYTLELFHPCYGPGLEMRLRNLQGLQQLLGEVSDCRAAASVLAQSMTRSPQLAGLEKLLKERAGAASRRFQEHWTSVFDAPGEEQRWTRYLALQARTPRRRG